jgi:hypothetical protein
MLVVSCIIIYIVIYINFIVLGLAILECRISINFPNKKNWNLT